MVEGVDQLTPVVRVMVIGRWVLFRYYGPVKMHNSLGRLLAVLGSFGPFVSSSLLSTSMGPAASTTSTISTGEMNMPDWSASNFRHSPPNIWKDTQICMAGVDILPRHSPLGLNTRTSNFLATTARNWTPTANPNTARLVHITIL